jgi:hypothetical protein
MPMTAHRDTATIYAFPSGGRASRGGNRKGEPAHPPPAKIAHAECGSGWYHEAAVEEAEHASALARGVRLFPDRI